MVYRIFEGNMDRLEKKLQRIANKCKKYGNEFRYEIVGEEYADIEDENGETHTRRFVLVEAEGTAIVNDWRFIAAVEHTKEGNILHNATNIEIPKKYYTTAPVCEHCNSKRARKDTFIVQNTVTGEFKQVGKSCLTDFTHGMSAEGVAYYTSLFNELIEGEAPLPGGRYNSYIKTEEALRYIAETVRYFGYVKSEDPRPTRERALEYYRLDHGILRTWGDDREYRKRLRAEMDSVTFDPESEYAKKLTKDALAWLGSLDKEQDGNYLHNLRTACALEYVDFGHFGLLASLFPSYNKALVVEEKRAKEKEENKASEYVGKKGDRIEVEIKDFRCVTSWYTQYGLTNVYLIHGTDGNTYTWKTGNGIPDNATKLIGTVKEHKEYNDCKQTELTRCKVVAEQKKEKESPIEGYRNPADEDMDYFYNSLEER